MTPKPEIKREVTIVYVSERFSSIHMDIVSNDAMSDLAKYGKLQEGDTRGHTLYVYARYDFLDVVNYIKAAYPQ